MNKLNDNKNEQASYFEKKLKEYNNLKEKQEYLQKRVNDYHKFIDYMQNLDKESKKYNFLWFKLGLHNFHYDGTNVVDLAEVHCARGGAESNKDIDIEIINAVIETALKIYEKHFNEVNDKIVNFNFLEGVDRNES